MIRACNPCDLDQIVELWFQGNLDAHDFISRSYWEQHIPMVREQLAQAELYVYETDGLLQGFAGLQEDYLAGIFIRKEFRCMGIGKQLLDHVKTVHPVLTLNVYQKNERAAAFYKREGFSTLAEDMDEETGEIDYTMEWNAKEH